MPEQDGADTRCRTPRDATLQAIAAARFVRARWVDRIGGAASLERRQRRGLERLLRERMPRAAHYRGGLDRLGDAPVVDKATVLADFSGFNVRGIPLDTALAEARAAEASRDFRGELPGGVTVGLSSGTSGRPGVFLVDPAERMRWAGTVLGRLLDRRSLVQLVQPWLPPLRIAFALRANSNLYESVASRRLSFAFVDLVAPFEQIRQGVAGARPDVLVAPSSLLVELARAGLRGELGIEPRLVVAVAEVLDDADSELVESAWGVRPRRVYQATEGLLALDCDRGRLHLNEQSIVVESEWIDGSEVVGGRFVPIVTDFDRSTQLIVRYRLDDVLRMPARGQRCGCGNPARVIDAVEGRADEVIEAFAPDGRVVRVFPDAVRRAMTTASTAEWGIRWAPDAIEVAIDPLDPEHARAVRGVLARLFETVGAVLPELDVVALAPRQLGAKQVRIARAHAATQEETADVV
ncbi:F390 synthetase-related protein [Agromyces laixinhei]|uniref:F390 synthetase-related protein n=1 Tax=Agromyces laixinhei TaxID=2585717 RepID=UPI0018DC6307|nr:F390 synthetase-related protein [Agromyces laixinhei]